MDYAVCQKYLEKPNYFFYNVSIDGSTPLLRLKISRYSFPQLFFVRNTEILEIKF